MRWPAQNAIANKLKNSKCERLFVQIGQWPASHYMYPPFSFGLYYEKMKQHVQNILTFLEDNPDGMVYLPTLDQGPLIGKVNGCSDWRTPTRMDGYSFVYQLIAQELNPAKVKYIDNNFILYTHWDGHPDWQHLVPDVRYQKTLYMAAIMLGEWTGPDLDYRYNHNSTEIQLLSRLWGMKQ
mmetsp:Transcript_2138/g.4833  ORF Transcript_2138/g.4833 Transcript_2138/m.4833 type:complete len:181 (-) Transcript_2138:396-938(-)